MRRSICPLCRYKIRHNQARGEGFCKCKALEPDSERVMRDLDELVAEIKRDREPGSVTHLFIPREMLKRYEH